MLLRTIQDWRALQQPPQREDLDLMADLRGVLARDVPLAFGFALLTRASS